LAVWNVATELSLKNRMLERMLHDDSTVKMAAHAYTVDAEEVIEQESEAVDPVHVNDDFDDIFGSSPGSPAFPHDHDDDRGIPAEEGRLGGNSEWSDIPRLKEKHETEGYRDGVTKGKAESVQKGFDEGYSLGATLGLRIGKILGILEGVYHALQMAVKDPANSETNEEWEAQRQRLEKLWTDAKTELKTQSVFGKEWWGEDGIWKFEVPGEGEGKEVLFPDVAAAHPMIVKWEKVVQQEVKMWGLDLGLMEHEQEEKEVGKGAKTKEEPPARAALGAAKELAW
jgi:hypothetical protein